MSQLADRGQFTKPRREPKEPLPPKPPVSTMLHEMAAAIADECDAPQDDGEEDSHFILDMFSIAADPAAGAP